MILRLKVLDLISKCQNVPSIKLQLNTRISGTPKGSNNSYDVVTFVWHHETLTVENGCTAQRNLCSLTNS